MFNAENILEENRDHLKNHPDYVNVGEMAALEEELNQLKEAHNIGQKRGLLFSFVDRLLADSEKKYVSRKKYIKLALGIGWLTGAHRFYAGQKIRGLLYLLFFWTGIPFAMTVVDLMVVLPMQPDEKGEILL